MSESVASPSFSMDGFFSGQFDMTVDDKLRIVIPDRLMKILLAMFEKGSPDAGGLGILPTSDHSLKLVPLPKYRKRMEYLRKLNPSIEEQRRVRNFEFRLASDSPFDAQNRIKLNPQQIEWCKLTNKKKAVIYGDGDWMQLFDPEVFAEVQEKDAEGYNAAANVVAQTVPEN